MHTRVTTSSRMAAIIVALVSGLALSGCSILTTFIDTVADSKDDGNVFILKPGDCFQEPEFDKDDLVSRVEIVECSVEHDNEAFATTNMPGEVFPGDEAIEDHAFDFCLDAFLDFLAIDMDYEGSEDFSFLWPTRESWADGDREILCYAFDTDGRTTGSLHGAGLNGTGK